MSLFSKHLLSVYSVLGTVLDIGDGEGAGVSAPEEVKAPARFQGIEY